VYVERNIEARSCNLCCNDKAVSITYYECVFVTLVLCNNYKEKTAGSQTTQTVLDHWPKIATITGKQASSVQSNPETYLDLWCTIVGIGIKL